MPANGTYLILITAASIALLLFLILAVKLHAFLTLVITSMALGLAAGMPPEKVLRSIQTGFGDALGFIAMVVGLGAMIGRYLETSGGGVALADWLLARFGRDRAPWAILIAAFLVGLPIFFEVGFIVLIPLVWSLARETKRSLLFFGVPMALALTITHSLVPPHPGPAAAAQLLNADLGRTILYGVALSIPIAIVTGVFWGNWIGKRTFVDVPEIAATTTVARDGERPAPPVWAVVVLLVLPVALIFGATMATLGNVPFRGVAVFVGHPFTALTIAALVSLYFFGIRRGVSREKAVKIASDSLAPMGALLCIMGGGGAFKQVIVDSGVGDVAGRLLVTSSISPLIVVFVIAIAMRIAQGSATVSIITTAGIVGPIVKGIPGYSPELIVLTLCCAASGPSHVNDSGFWIVNQYFGISVPQTFWAWTVPKILGAFVGFAIILAAHALFR